jgi:hypothetical protein
MEFRDWKIKEYGKKWLKSDDQLFSSKIDLISTTWRFINRFKKITKMDYNWNFAGLIISLIVRKSITAFIKQIWRQW